MGLKKGWLPLEAICFPCPQFRSTNPLCSTCGMQAKGQGEVRGAAAVEAKLFHSQYTSSTPLPEDED